MSYQPRASLDVPPTQMYQVQGGGNVSQGQRLQLLNTDIPEGALLAILTFHSCSSPIGTETYWVASAGHAAIDFLTGTVKFSYQSYSGVDHEYGSGEISLTSAPAIVFPISLSHRMQIEDYTGASGKLKVFSEDHSVETGDAAVSANVEFTI